MERDPGQEESGQEMPEADLFLEGGQVFDTIRSAARR